MPSSRLTGILMLAGGAVVVLLGGAVLAPRYLAEEISLSAAVLGFALVVIIALPLAGGGVYMLVHSTQDVRAEAEAQQQRRLLDMVQARGQLSLSDAAIELQAPRDQVRRWVTRLVGLGVFTGYVNWEDGILYSAEAAQLRERTTCVKCGGKMTLAGKGVVRCPFCGTEYFLGSEARV